MLGVAVVCAWRCCCGILMCVVSLLVVLEVLFEGSSVLSGGIRCGVVLMILICFVHDAVCVWFFYLRSV